MKIYCDLDGVLTDFNKMLSKVLHRPMKGEFGNDPKIWGAITKAGKPFWVDMEWMPDGRQLWEAVEMYEPTILTAPTRHKDSIEGKKEWLAENLPDVPFIIDQDKASHAEKGDILIDDREKNIKKWEEAGGVGILHKDTETTIDKLKKALGSMDKDAGWITTTEGKRTWIDTSRGKTRPSKPIKPEKGPGSYKREKDWRKVITALDLIANDLESKGLVREAERVDILSNTLEVESKELPHKKNRPAPVFPKESPKVKDDKDHFPIPDSAHGRNALARVNQYGEVPSWYDGSLEELKAAVVKAVHSKFPGIEVEKEKY